MSSLAPSKNLISQYQRLNQYFNDQKEVKTSIEQVAEALCCTRRNVNNVLNKMSQQGWLTWLPARGRGKLSQLIFHSPTKAPALQLAMSKASEGLLQEAFSLLPNQTDKNDLFNYLKTQLGFKNELHGDQLLRMPYHRSLPNLDPTQATRITEIHMINQIMDTLVTYDRQNQCIKPNLAHSWKSDEAGTCWHFYLRPGIKFHHGRLLNCEDVKATLNHLKSTPSPFQGLYQHISKIDCLTPLSIKIELSSRNFLLLHLLASHCSSIQPSDLMHQPNFAHQPVGTGPFMVIKNNEFQLQLDANLDYFQARALLDRIEIWFFADQKLALEQHSDLIISDTSTAHHDASMRQNSKIEKGYQYLLFNVAKHNSPLQNLRIRRSIRSMLDTTRLIKELGGTRAAPARRLLTEWEADTQRLMFPVRPRMPMRLQEPLKLVTYDIHMEDAKWIKKSLANFEIPIQISELAYTDFANPDNWLDADLVLSGEALDDNLEMALYEWFATQRSLRHCMGDEVRQQLDDKLIQAISLAQKNERMEAFRAMDIFLQQQLVLLPLYHHQQLLHYGDRVQGLNLNSLGWVDFKDIWFT